MVRRDTGRQTIGMTEALPTVGGQGKFQRVAELVGLGRAELGSVIWHGQTLWHDVEQFKNELTTRRTGQDDHSVV
jgi:hypothetical protein